MAAELTQWLTTAQANVTTLTAQEEEQKAKLKKLNRKAQKKRRLARIREAKRAKAIMQMEDEIGKVQGQMRELVEAERQRSERFLSLARKYYGMWKTLNEKCQQKSAWKSQSSQAKDSNSNVRFQLFSFCTPCLFSNLSGKEFNVTIFPIDKILHPRKSMLLSWQAKNPIISVEFFFVVVYLK